MKIRRQTCQAHFKGRDSFGTCDTKCQWYSKKGYCTNSKQSILKLELIKIADKSLGYNGLGTKMTPKEINIIFDAIIKYLGGLR